MIYIKTYKLYETGEWSKDVDWEYVKNNPDDDSEEANLIKDLQVKIEEVISLLHNDNILKIESIRGVDLYQGAYAIVSIFSKKYKVWEIYSEDYLYIEGFPINNTDEYQKDGYRGDVVEISDLLNEIYKFGGIEIYNSSKKFNI